MKLNYKLELFNAAVKILEERISTNRLAIDNAQASANEEEKSSAGDKYETSRAMSHIEKDMYSKQLTLNNAEMSSLLRIDHSKYCVDIEPGAVIKSKDYTFFIAAGLGKIIIKEEVIYFLSPKAPLAISLYQKKKGDCFLFNKTEMIILDIF